MAVQRDNAIDHLVTRLASSAASAADGGRRAGRLMDPQKGTIVNDFPQIPHFTWTVYVGL
jgi:hypothetical protein